jgi:DNA mismatch repair protein MSH2
MAPANLKELFPTIERIWKKRKVTIEDIRRVLFIQDATPSVYAMPDIPKFRISNYGTRHVIERMDSAARHSEKPLKEAELTVLFLRNLEAFWRSQPEKPVDADLTQDIPLAPIHTSGSTGSSQKAMRQRLLDIQGGTMRYKPTETSEKTEDARIAASGSDSLLSRKSSLLSRLQAKGLRQSTLVPPPSKEAILRRSAAERLPEVINVLLLLSPPMPNTDDGDQIPNFTPKKAFSMPTIIQNIRDSMRNPISKQEAEMCFDLLSRREVAGDWITIVTVKRLKSVVIRGGRNIPTQEIMKQVADLTF